MRLRKRMSPLGVFAGDLSIVPQSTFMASITNRPWMLFILTSVLPILLMALLFIFGKSMGDPRHQQIILAQMTVLFFGVLIAGSYLVHTLRYTLKMVIDELERGMDSIRQGQFNNRVAVLMDDETGKMARSLNTALEGSART